MSEPLTCPQCGRVAEPDGREPAEIAGLTFRSVTCEQPPANLSDHPFPVRWLEAHAGDAETLQDFHDRWVRVRGPLPEGTPVAEAFGEIDPILAWVEDEPSSQGGSRVLIRL